MLATTDKRRYMTIVLPFRASLSLLVHKVAFLVSFECCGKLVASPTTSLLQPFAVVYTSMKDVLSSNAHGHALYNTVTQVASLSCGLHHLVASCSARREPTTNHHHSVPP